MSIKTQNSAEDDLEHIIIIGCSAGGTEEVIQLVPQLNLQQAALIVVPHLEGREIYEGLRQCNVNVRGIQDETEILNGAVYVMGYHTDPPLSQSLLIGRQHLQFVGNFMGNYGFIDFAMTSAAQNHGEKCIGVILSGTGNDGAEGVKRVKANNGRVALQIYYKPDTIRYNPSMAVHAFNALKKEGMSPDLMGSLDEIANYLNNPNG